MKDISASERITIVLCTYNGAAFLRAQLASYLVQRHESWDLWVSDDGSTDETWEILRQFQAEHGRTRQIRLLEGPRAGVAANFLSVLCHPDLPARPVALSDQDDVWLPEKLELALREMDGDTPLLYGAQSRHTDIELNPVGQSLGGGDPGFGNALVQNIVSGHSMTLNAAALAEVRAAGVPQGIPYHDWWIYQLITAVGGRVIVRPDTVLLYRQHTRNAMGSHQGVAAALTRAGQLFGRRYGDWIAANTAALRQIGTPLSPAASRVLDALATTPRGVGLARFRVFYRHGIRRQGRLGTLLLFCAVLLGRV